MFPMCRIADNSCKVRKLPAHRRRLLARCGFTTS